MIADTPVPDRPSSLRVVILYNEPILAEEHPDADSEHEIYFTTEFVQQTLIEAGYDISMLGVSRDPAVLLDGLRDLRPDVVFNLFEGLADFGETEAHAAGILEWLEIPYTGCPYQTLCLARGKHLTKHLLAGAGLPTAKFFVVEDVPIAACPLGWPVIVKPANQDASIGVDQGSVVTDLDRLNERIAYLLDNYGPPVLVEEFIRGREFSLGLVEAPELCVLPVSEILFVEKDPDYWPIVTYDAKWKPGTRDYEATPPKYPARISPRLRSKLETLAKRASVCWAAAIMPASISEYAPASRTSWKSTQTLISARSPVSPPPWMPPAFPTLNSLSIWYSAPSGAAANPPRQRAVRSPSSRTGWEKSATAGKMLKAIFFEEPAMILPDFLTRQADSDIRLTGHRIGLYTVVRLYREGRNAEQIAEELESLGLALVYKVLAFYLDNQVEVDAYVDAYTVELERQEALYSNSPVAVKMRRLRDLLRQADERFGSEPGWAIVPIPEKIRRIEEAISPAAE